MDKILSSEKCSDFFSNPVIAENFPLLQKIGVVRYIESLNNEISNYKSLFKCALDIFNRNTIDEIIEAAVHQISDHFLPSFICFLWKPLANKDDIIIKSYKNYKLIDLHIPVDSITPFDTFFRTYRSPISYGLFTVQLEAGEVFNTINPEIVVPILGPSGLYGLVLVGHRMLQAEYNTAELSFLQELMSFVSQSVQNHLNYERTLKDVKTGLYNYNFFKTRLSEELARIQRNDTVSSIIIIDVDKFKNFNDTYGHLAGDKVLEFLSLAIKDGIRSEDIPSRFGGEEFTILLPDCDSKSAWAVAERLRLSVAEMKIPWDPPVPKITISLGVYTFGKEGAVGTEEIINRADSAMYLSKERGRNRTTLWNCGLMARIELMNLSL